MKKVIRKFWGVGLVIILLSTLFVGAAAPAAAANYSWATAAMLPSALSGVLAPAAGFGIVDVAQSGSTIYAIGEAGATQYLYKSADGGATWAPVTTGLTAGINYDLIAVAPDDANTVVIVDQATSLVYYSSTGGTGSQALGTTGFSAIYSVDISPLTTSRTIIIGGAEGIATWTLGLVAPVWTPNNTLANPIYAVRYSANYAADAGIMAVSYNATGNTTLNVFSTNIGSWNPTGYGYPKTIAAITSLVKATIVLDPNFYLGDDATQIGFVTISDGAGTAGGVYSIGATGMTRIFGASAPNDVNNIAWDGTNMMVAPAAAAAVDTALTIYRSSNALAFGATFLPSSELKTPGTGSMPLVLFNGGVGYAFSQGNNSAIAKSADLGKTWNGFALVNSNFGTIEDFWLSPDGTRAYAVVDDAVDDNVWRYNNGVWQRVMILTIETNAWLVRADADTPDTVYLGMKTQNTMYKSLDGGETSWIIRASSAAIADFAVQDANILYVVSSATGNVYKSTNGAFTWTFTPVFVGANGYSIILLADDSLVAGSTLGGVAYTADGAAWTAITGAAGTGNTVVAATGTAAGDTLFAGSSVVGSWTIGTSTTWSAYTPAAGTISGLAYGNGILYAVNDTANASYRWFTPTIGAAFGPNDTYALAQLNNQANLVNNLLITTGSNKVWTVVQAATDDVFSFTDYMIGDATIPVPTYPINGQIINVNSITGAANPFNFMFNAPPAAASTPLTPFLYNIGVFLDEAGTIALAGAPAGNVGTVVPSTAVYTPGQPYYWRVRVAANNPALGSWTAMQMFSVQQLQAIVPVLGAPANGSSVPAGQTVAFSWNPIANASSYQLEVSTDPAFATTVYSTTTSAAGASIPSTVSLTPGTTYFWRVKVLTPAEGEYSTVGNFTVAEEVTETTTEPPVVTTTSIIITETQTTVTVPTPTTTVVSPAYIWAIIIIGAVLVIAVIVLIVRTRRSV